METAIVTAVLNGLTAIASLTSSASVIGKVITILEALLPAIVEEFETLKQPVMNVISALTSNTAITAAQLADLKSLDLSTDDAFEDSVEAYLANHPAPATGS